MVKWAEGAGNAPASALPILFSGQVQPAPKAFGASLYLPAFRKCGMGNGECGMTEGPACDSVFRTPHSAFKMAARVGLAPTPNGLIPIPNRDYFHTTWQL